MNSTTVKHINISKIKTNTIPLHTLASEYNAWMANAYTEPKFRFNEDGEFDRTGEYIPDPHALAVLTVKMMAIVEREHGI